MKNTSTHIFIIAALTAIAPASTKGESLSTSKRGIYLGAALGGADLSVKNNLLLSWLPGAAPARQNFSLNTTDKNIAADIFVGYGRCIDCFSVEGELIGSFAPLKSTSALGITTANPQSLEIKTTNALGGFLNLGYYINTTNKLYFKIGFERRRFKVAFKDPSNLFIALNKNYNSTAFVPGIGMELDLTPRLSLRAEYRIALHPKKTTEVANAATSQITSAQIKPTIHYLNLGLVFKI